MKHRIVEPAPHDPWRLPYWCTVPWPEELYLQFGRRGYVYCNSTNTSYITPFFEAMDFACFVRGEGPTIFEAERDAWNQYVAQIGISEEAQCQHKILEAAKKKHYIEVERPKQIAAYNEFIKTGKLPD